MSHYSVFDLFCIGIGPSSSHTVGPMRAAKLFLEKLTSFPQIEQVVRIKCNCHGSLAATGKGHSTDTAIMLGFLGELPEETNPELVPEKIAQLTQSETLHLTEGKKITFIPSRDVDLNHNIPLKLHPNGMHFFALDSEENILIEEVIYSTGGGLISTEKEMLFPREDQKTNFPYPYESALELLDLCTEKKCNIADIVMANECALRPEKEVRKKLLYLWKTMEQCIERGLKAKGNLPGALNIPRRARKLHISLMRHVEDSLRDPLSILDWVNLYAIAVNEENAAGGRIITAPTNGAAGIIPAVLKYAVKFASSPYKDAIERFLLTAGGIAILYKKNASISGADVGCQGEVGVACSMAAAALTDYMGGTAHQIENAAEIGIEHNLGLTCDPIAGLVQIPCIERNAIAAIKALNASRIALRNKDGHFVPLDKAIRTMLDTGRDMMSKYKETAQGGLAVNVVNC